MDVPQLVHELRRRRVFRVLVGYGVAAFGVLQVAEPVAHGLRLPEWTLSGVVVALGLGFPVAVALAWAFDLRRTGIERTPPAPGGAGRALRGPRLAAVLAALGAAAAAPGLGWHFLGRGGTAPPAAAWIAVSAALVAVALVAALLAAGGARAPAAGGAGEADAAAGAAPSIAVIPFTDLSPGRDQGYFTDGIAEEILNALCGVRGLRVAARSASFPWRGRSADPRAIGRALGVATLLEGSVRKSGNRVRVGARLVSAATGYQLWSASFDRALEDVFAIQEEIAQAVVRALELRLGRASPAPLTRAGTRNLQAYEMYLRGRQFLMSLTENGYRFGRQMFKGALELDPAFPQAHAGLADTDYFILQWHLDDARADALRGEALAASEEALRLDPELAEAHVSRGNVLSFLGRAEEAERHFRRALALNPALPHAWYFHGRHLFAAGRLEEAARAFEENARLDPDDYATLSLLVTLYKGRSDPEKVAAAARRAAEAAERRLRLNPDDVRALYMGGGARVILGERARGLELIERALELQPGDFATLYNAACGLANAGEIERALDVLDRAVATGRGFRGWMEHDGDLDPLRAHPRFREILARVAG